ncbi:MAG TPA: molybdopterin converting factor subunit 1 [Hyphomicrobiaceae bacterium]|nr:molybdopterin converting factor subunit 1 [Hyphomicrobiaceae bacterium]
MQLKILYFAWVRERIGRAGETIELTARVRTVADLIAALKSRGPEYAHAFERADIIRAAIDHVHVKHDAPITGAREVAFFPPVTGG